MIATSRAGDYQHAAEKVVSIERKRLSVFGLHPWPASLSFVPNDSTEKSPKPHAKAQSSKEFLRCCSGLLNVRRRNLEILLRDLAALREIIVLSVESPNAFRPMCSAVLS
jgi:hypothetical protein